MDERPRRYESLEDYLIDCDRRRAGLPPLWESAEEKVRRLARERRQEKTR